MKLSFNPSYVFKPDEGRVLILSKETLRTTDDSGLDDNFESAIHPVYAMILSFFCNTEYDEAIDNATDYLEVDRIFIKKFVDSLIENDEIMSIKSGQLNSIFPKNTLIKKNVADFPKYNPDSFLYDEIDVRLKRHKTPTDITLMVNTICATDCFYCYADRRVKMNCKIPLTRIYKLIDEAKSFNARGFEVIGGEFFLYKHWKEVLVYLYKNNFAPYVSTKVPLSRESIYFLSENNIRDIQVSLDSLISGKLIEILNVKDDYIDKMKQTLIDLNEAKVRIYIHTILNAKNQFFENMSSIYDFIKEMDNVITWRIDKAGPSLYTKNGYDIFKVNKLKTEKVYNYFKKIGELTNKFKISYEAINPSSILEDSIPKVREGRAMPVCTANNSKLFILPDGNVTICEELYWHPQFIIGNVLENSLLEIWNSDYAKYLRMIPKSQIPIDSPCSVCNNYISCKEANQTCWRDTLKGYGNDKWYYPDVACKMAPPLKFYVE